MRFVNSASFANESFGGGSLSCVMGVVPLTAPLPRARQFTAMDCPMSSFGHHAADQDGRGGQQEAPCIVHLAVVETERLLVKVTEQMKRFDGQDTYP